MEVWARWRGDGVETTVVFSVFGHPELVRFHSNGYGGTK